MAESMTPTVFQPGLRRPVTKVVLAWVSSAGGTVTQTTTFKVSGLLRRVVTVPSATVAPTADYDVVIEDSDGLDILNAAGADRHTTNTEVIAPLISTYGPMLVSETALTLKVTNAGAAKAGTIYLFFD